MAGTSAVQMYTLRELCKTTKDFADSLKRVSDIGYTAVQLSGIGCMGGESPEVDAKEGRRMLDDNGLRCAATHRSWDALAGQTEAEIEFHQTLGCDYAAIGGLPPAYREDGEAGFRRFVQESAPKIAKLKAAGITFGYHNHAHEFVRILPGTSTWYDVFVDEGGPDFTLEIDTYWAAHAGVEPVRLIKRCAGRLPVVHLKDKTVVGNDTNFAPIGEGNLAWDDILPAFDAAGTQVYAVEQDNCYDRDPFDCLRSSYDFLASKGLD